MGRGVDTYTSNAWCLPPETKKLLFLDLGANIGMVSKFFFKYHRKTFRHSSLELHIHAFEPLAKKLRTVDKYPRIKASIEELGGTFVSKVHEKVVWTHDGVVSFSRGNKINCTNSAVTKVVNAVGANKAKYDMHKEFECVDISRWIQSHLRENNYDAVFVKMDIEGAEYAVIDKMISDNTVSLIDKMFIEFHKIERAVDEETSIRECVAKVYKASDTIVLYTEEGRLNPKRPDERYKLVRR